LERPRKKGVAGVTRQKETRQKETRQKETRQKETSKRKRGNVGERPSRRKNKKETERENNGGGDKGAGGGKPGMTRNTWCFGKRFVR
jgi:hypothetical protein